MSIKELLFGIKDDNSPDEDALFREASRYFAEYQKGLSQGGVKRKCGRITINISFVVDEGKA